MPNSLQPNRDYTVCPHCSQLYHDEENTENIKEYGQCLMCEKERNEQFNLE